MLRFIFFYLHGIPRVKLARGIFCREAGPDSYRDEPYRPSLSCKAFYIRFVHVFKLIVTDSEPHETFVRHAAPPVGFVGSVNQTVAQTFGRNVPAIGRDKQHFIIRKHDSLRFGKAPNGTTRDARPSPETTLIRLRHPWNDLRIF